jgi:hypothetical protein
MSESIIVHIDPDLEDLIPGFLGNRRRDVATLEALVEQRNFTAIRIIGHSMKGAGGGYGFDPITDIGDQLEVAALASDDAAIRRLTAQLADYLTRVKPVAS